MATGTTNSIYRRYLSALFVVLGVSVPGVIVWRSGAEPSEPVAEPHTRIIDPSKQRYNRRHMIDTSGFMSIASRVPPWLADAAPWIGSPPRGAEWVTNFATTWTPKSSGAACLRSGSSRIC